MQLGGEQAMAGMGLAGREETTCLKTTNQVVASSPSGGYCLVEVATGTTHLDRRWLSCCICPPRGLMCCYGGRHLMMNHTPAGRS